MDACAVLNERASQNAAIAAGMRSQKEAALLQLKQTAHVNPGVIPSGEVDRSM